MVQHFCRAGELEENLASHYEYNIVMADRQKKRFTIPRDGKPNLYFEGVQLGAGRTAGNQVTLYKAASGKYVMAIETKERDPFSFPAQPDRYAIVAATLETLILDLQKTIGVYNDAVKAAFFEASDAEPALRQYSVEEV